MLNDDEQVVFRFNGHGIKMNDEFLSSSPPQPLDYENKRRYVMAAEAVNDPVDTTFLPLEEFTDRTTLKIVVEDVDEPPVFLTSVYEWKVPENAAVGTVVGSVSARDTDTVNNPIR